MFSQKKSAQNNNNFWSKPVTYAYKDVAFIKKGLKTTKKEFRNKKIRLN